MKGQQGKISPPALSIRLPACIRAFDKGKLVFKSFFILEFEFSAKSLLVLSFFMYKVFKT